MIHCDTFLANRSEAKELHRHRCINSIETLVTKKCPDVSLHFAHICSIHTDLTEKNTCVQVCDFTIATNVAYYGAL